MVQILLIAVFMAMFVADAAAGAWVRGVPAGAMAGGVLGAMGGIAAAAHLMILRQVRRMDRTGDARSVTRADLTAAAARFAAVVVHIVAVVVFGWVGVVRGIVGDLIVVDELLAAAPAVFVFVATWWSLYPIDRRLREAVVIRDLDMGRPFRPVPSRAAHVLSAVRHQAALVLVPVTGVLAWYETVDRLVPRLGTPGWVPVVLLEVAGMVVVLSLMPAVMRRVWDTVALESGPLRERLLGMCRRHGVRVRELLVWRTDGTMINGAVMGFLGPMRYVLLTDALLEYLPGPQVEAVMAHEIGHVRRRHMLWLGVAALSVVLLTMAGVKWSVERWGGDWSRAAWVEGLVSVAGLGVGLLSFGFISRRFEWQADAFAVQHLSGAGEGRDGAAPVVTGEAVAAMSGALDAVARLNHVPREKFTWRHGSIGERQRRLWAMVGQRVDRLKVDREVRAVKMAAAAAMVAAVWVVAKMGVG